MESTLLSDSAVPLYRQLLGQLRRRIEAGEFEPGSRVPSENQLASEYGISRATARHVLSELESESWIVRIVGKGSFVARNMPIDHITGFGDNMRAIGRVPSYRVCSMDTVVPSSQDAGRLELSVNERAHRIVRLLLADDEPVAIADSLLPSRYLAQATAQLTSTLLNESSLYAYLENQLGVQLHRAIEEVEPHRADEDDAAVLEIAEDDLILRVIRLVYDQNDRPIELARIDYVSERFRYRTELFRGQRR